jgi:hypothetical protein
MSKMMSTVAVETDQVDRAKKYAKELLRNEPALQYMRIPMQGVMRQAIDLGLTQMERSLKRRRAKR